MAKVLKSFPYSPNGYTVEILKVGDDRDFGAATQGLIDRGDVEGAKPVAAPVAKPAVAPVVKAK